MLLVQSSLSIQFLYALEYLASPRGSCGTWSEFTNGIGGACLLVQVRAFFGARLQRLFVGDCLSGIAITDNRVRMQGWRAGQNGKIPHGEGQNGKIPHGEDVGRVYRGGRYG